MATNYIVPPAVHNDLVAGAYRKRGYAADESQAAARFSEITAWHGIKTHNAIKALHLDELFGSKSGGCVPAAKIEKLPSKYKAVQRWNANRKLGQAVAFEAMDTAMKLADEFGVGVVSVDNAFHYLWGGGYVIDAAKKGYLAYTCCTAALAEVVPFGGKFPTLGTNPHSWGFPTQDVIGYPICIDWATSTVAMGRVQQFAREGKQLPPGCAVDEQGKETTDPNKVKALMPFGQHKGYGLSLIDELYAAYIGGSIPTIRNRWDKVPSGEKGTCCFFFQCIKPEAINGENFASGRTQNQNVKAVIEDILGHGNEKCMLPGQIEAQGAALSAKHGGLIFTQAEVDALKHIAEEASVKFDADSLKKIEI
ncbi:MAG TPA: Ldh family oxidoreductase [Tepidisphaeraceae bacterium]|jgi:LDH2 family malate/lactate/ureidoglycolate dehydrogenase|nr:Ldh family oxidoreductase [Tepidisphaeraceae bacterium]